MTDAERLIELRKVITNIELFLAREQTKILTANTKLYIQLIRVSELMEV